jgi:hypothetical protein
MPTAWDNINTSNPTTQTNNLPKIAIASPYNGTWYPEWVEKTYLSLITIPSNLYQKITFLSKVPSLPVARDLLVGQALKVNADYIFFLDTDIVFENPSNPNVALDQLFQVMNKSKDNKDSKIVSGLYRAKQKQGFNYAMWIKQDNGFVPIAEWTGNWLNVDVTGLGCCLIDMDVFKNTPRPWFHWDLGEEMSEDFYFHQLAKKHGYSIHVFTDIKLSHLGELKIKSDGTITIQEV